MAPWPGVGYVVITSPDHGSALSAERAIETLDRASPVPLHSQLRAVIDGRIESGRWTADERVPSERELCEQFGVSRITVRQALHQLVVERRLVRVHGRGTFVASAPVKAQLLPLVGFSEDMSARGQHPGARVLRFEVAVPSMAVSRALRLSGGEEVFVLKRLRLANDRPMALETAYLPEKLCRALAGVDMADRSLYRTLGETCGLTPWRALQQWQAVPCPSAEAKLLGIRGGTPVLQIQRTTFDNDGRTFEYVDSFVRGDRYVFQAELRRPDAAGPARP
jgi:GntR family transcriptional regulator